LQIEYKSHGIKEVCENAHEAEKAYGTDIAKAIHKRIPQIKAMDTVEELIRYRIGKCHALTADRKGKYAMHLTANYRLIFSKKDGDAGMHIQIAMIEKVEDYH